MTFSMQRSGLEYAIHEPRNNALQLTLDPSLTFCWRKIKRRPKRS